MSLDELISKSTTRFWQSQGQLDAPSSSGPSINGKRKSAVLLESAHDDALKEDKENNEIQKRVKKKRARNELVMDDQEAVVPTNTAARSMLNTKGTSGKSRGSRRSPRLASKLPTPQASNNTKRSVSFSESLQRSIASQFSWSQGEKQRSVRPSYEPPSVKRRKLRQSGQLPKYKTTATVMEKKLSKERPFCPIEASKQSILAEMKKLEEDHTGSKQNMQLEHHALGLKVWDRISTLNEEQKVEVIVAGVATSMKLSHLRLTRFLKGNKDNLLSAAQVNKISKKLEDWLEDDD
jgi:hypothetical protein